MSLKDTKSNIYNWNLMLKTSESLSLISKELYIY